MYFTKEHEWVKIVDDTAEIGITDYAQKSLGDVVFIELPEIGTVFNSGEEISDLFVMGDDCCGNGVFRQVAAGEAPGGAGYGAGDIG